MAVAAWPSSNVTDVSARLSSFTPSGDACTRDGPPQFVDVESDQRVDSDSEFDATILAWWSSLQPREQLVGEELLSLLRSGVAAEQIGIVCPSLERWQAPLETALGTLGVPYALEGYARLDKTPYGQALLSLLRFAWLGGGRGDLYTFLRSPYSSLTRQNVDFLEGRLRGRAVDSPERVEEGDPRVGPRPQPGRAGRPRGSRCSRRG